MSFLSRFYKHKLLQNGKRIVKATQLKDVVNLIHQLKPIHTDKNLLRLGGDSDGGYLVPDDLDNIAACFSPGVSDIADFEKDMLDRNIPCYLADASVDGPPFEHRLLHFDRKFLGSDDSEQFMSLESWVEGKGLPEGSDFLLQMDIEGAEYEVILASSDRCLSQFRVMAIEFHHLDRLVERNVFPFISQAFKKLLKNFDVVHIHPNNNNPSLVFHELSIPPTLEFTFLRKDRVKTRGNVPACYPHPLDRPNTLLKPDFPLPECWYV